MRVNVAGAARETHRNDVRAPAAILVHIAAHERAWQLIVRAALSSHDSYTRKWNAGDARLPARGAARTRMPCVRQVASFADVTASARRSFFYLHLLTRVGPRSHEKKRAPAPVRDQGEYAPRPISSSASSCYYAYDALLTFNCYAIKSLAALWPLNIPPTPGVLVRATPRAVRHTHSATPTFH